MMQIFTDAELLDRMPEVFNEAENDWPRQFARSIIKQSNKPDWKPSPKQRAMMLRLVEQLEEYDFGPVVDLHDHPLHGSEGEHTRKGHIDRATV